MLQHSAWYMTADNESRDPQPLWPVACAGETTAYTHKERKQGSRTNKLYAVV
jgi:hypothetical protein